MSMSAILTGLGVAVAGLVKAIFDFIITHKEELSSIILRIEKDTADGDWTPEEKKAEALWLYTEQVKPHLPLQVKAILLIIPDALVLKWVEQWLENFIKKSKKYSVRKDDDTQGVK